MTKPVPIVVYKGGVRTIVGLAMVEPDGSLQAQIAKDHWSIIKDVFRLESGEFVLSPAPASVTIVEDPKV